MNKFITIGEPAPAPYAGVVVEVKDVPIRIIRKLAKVDAMPEAEKEKNATAIMLYDVFEEVLCNYVTRSDGGPLLTLEEAEEMGSKPLSSLFRAVMDAKNEQNKEEAAKN